MCVGICLSVCVSVQVCARDLECEKEAQDEGHPAADLDPHTADPKHVPTHCGQHVGRMYCYLLKDKSTALVQKA
jgi:hypothetical protein